MRRKKRDKNERGIVDALEMVGCKVLRVDDDSRSGTPDLIARFSPLDCDCPYCRAGVLRWMEVKTKRGKLSDAQREFIAGWSNTVEVVRTIDDALKAVGR